MARLAGLTEKTRKLALDRFHLLQPHLEGNHLLRLVARPQGMPFRTAQRLAALYHQFGLTALVRRKRADRGGHRSVSGKIRKAIEGLALQSRRCRLQRSIAKSGHWP
jgi:putative transposase